MSGSDAQGDLVHDLEYRHRGPVSEVEGLGVLTALQECGTKDEVGAHGVIHVQVVAQQGAVAADDRCLGSQERPNGSRHDADPS